MPIRGFSLRTPQATEIGNDVVDFLLAEPGAVRGHERRLVQAYLAQVGLQERTEVVLLVAELDGDIVFIKTDSADLLPGFRDRADRPVAKGNIGLGLEQRLFEICKVAPAAHRGQLRSEAAASAADGMAGETFAFAFDHQLASGRIARSLFARRERAQPLQ